MRSLLAMVRHALAMPNDPSDTLFLSLTAREASIVAVALQVAEQGFEGWPEVWVSDWQAQSAELREKMAQACDAQKLGA